MYNGDFSVLPMPLASFKQQQKSHKVSVCIRCWPHFHDSGPKINTLINIKCLKLKSLVSYRLVHKNLQYFENIGPYWSKHSSFVDKHQILDVIDSIF